MRSAHMFRRRLYKWVEPPPGYDSADRFLWWALMVMTMGSGLFLAGTGVWWVSTLF